LEIGFRDFSREDAKTRRREDAKTRRREDKTAPIQSWTVAPPSTAADQLVKDEKEPWRWWFVHKDLFA
jgi:hypothetical protein